MGTRTVALAVVPRPHLFMPRPLMRQENAIRRQEPPPLAEADKSPPKVGFAGSPPSLAVLRSSSKYRTSLVLYCERDEDDHDQSFCHST